VLVLLVAVLIRSLDLTPDSGMWAMWSCTPTVAPLIMLLVLTREGSRSWV
jgi:hypothetical protein